MSAALNILLAILLSGAAPLSPDSWVRDIDYPPEAQRRGQQGSTAFTLIVSPQGKTVDCQITRSSGHPKLDSHACTLLKRRAEFDPARDIHGAPIHMLYRGVLNWAMGRMRNRLEYAPDVEVHVQKLPGGASETIVNVLVQSDASGHFVACGPAQDELASRQLVGLACKQAQPMEATIVKDDKGDPIAIVQALKVMFKATTS